MNDDTICPGCGSSNETSDSLCRSCGAALAPPPAPRDEARKVVTVVFSDVTGSTQLGEHLDPETVRRVMARYFEEMSTVLERHSGKVEKYIGDAVMAVFGLPHVHEDDALRAVRAAVEMRAALDELNHELQRNWGVTITMRTGINTGQVVSGDPRRNQSLVVGDAVNVAARLEQAADPGTILIGDATYQLVRDAVEAQLVPPLAVRGKGEPLTAWRVRSVTPGAAGWGRRLDSPLVGREWELAQFREVFDRAHATPACQVVTVMGAAGIGKSRLTNEFLGLAAATARVAEGHCLPYGEGITFWPIVQLLGRLADVGDGDGRGDARTRITALLGPGEEDAEIGRRLAGLLGAGETPGVQETFWAVRRLLERLAAERPLVVVFDDVHWGESTFLDLLEYLADWLAPAPALLVCLARPELLETRPGWMGGKPNHSLLRLEPLSEAGIEGLMRNLLRDGEVGEEARTRISQLAEGNPLFVEETIRMLVDDGLLYVADGRWTVSVDLSDVAIPPTISAILTARLDRLDPDERAVIQRASVVGRVFWWGAVAALSSEDARADVGHHLQSLNRKELVRPGHSELVGEDAFEFTHLLVRDAAYHGIPKETRAHLHERLAAWLVQKTADRLGEYEEILGYHLEQAYRSRLEVAPADHYAAGLAERAGARLASAGRRAFGRGDIPAAVNLLTRASQLFAGHDPQRLELLPKLAFALMDSGDFERLMAVVADSKETAAASGDPRLDAHATILELYIRLFTNPESWAEEAEREADRAISAFDQLGDELGLAKGWSLLGLVNVTRGRFADAQMAWERAAAHAHEAGERRDELEALSWVLLALWAGPAPAEEALRRCHEVLERAGLDHKGRASALFMRAVLEAGVGNVGQARDLILRARALLQEVGMTVWMAGPLTQMAGFVELAAGDYAAAERELRWGHGTLQAIGEMAWLPTLVAQLAFAVYQQGRYDEAEELTRSSQDMAGSEDVYSQVLWRSVAGRIAARAGRSADAETLIRESVSLAESTDSLQLRAEALLGLAEVLELTGRDGEASEVAASARHFLEQKGYLPAAERVSQRGVGPGR